jgi:hypothetical protein
MSQFLSALPLWALILTVIVIPTSLAIGVQVLVRRSVGVEKLALNNEVAGFIFAIIGVVAVPSPSSSLVWGEIQRGADLRRKRIRRRRGVVLLLGGHGARSR